MNTLYKKFKECKGVATDTRKDLTDMLFFCLQGERFNGNEFVPIAIEKGARYVVTNDKKWSYLPQAILVEDTLKTLQELALYHRHYLATPIIALTGSNGKTTTKELIYSVLNQSFRTLKTEGNFNNHLGVPLTLLRLTPETDMAAVILSRGLFDSILRVYIPECMPILLSSFGFCFAMSLGDATIPLVLSIRGFSTLALYTYNLAGAYRFNQACACGGIVALISMIIFLQRGVQDELLFCKKYI